jgi:hypothetical protein
MIPYQIFIYRWKEPDLEKLGPIWVSIFDELLELDNSNASSEILMIEISAWNANMILSNYQF